MYDSLPVALVEVDQERMAGAQKSLLAGLVHSSGKAATHSKAAVGMVVPHPASMVIDGETFHIHRMAETLYVLAPESKFSHQSFNRPHALRAATVFVGCGYVMRYLDMVALVLRERYAWHLRWAWQWSCEFATTS